VIYLVERDPVFEPALADAMGRRLDVRFAISPLVKLECSIGPLRRGDAKLMAEYRELFASLVTLPVPDAAFERAAELRAAHTLRTPDALHLAISQTAGCAELWTNDERLAGVAPGFAHVVRALAPGAAPD
jgi:predicted nucleic acid-binding protein